MRLWRSAATRLHATTQSAASTTASAAPWMPVHMATVTSLLNCLSLAALSDWQRLAMLKLLQKHEIRLLPLPTSKAPKERGGARELNYPAELRVRFPPREQVLRGARWSPRSSHAHPLGPVLSAQHKGALCVVKQVIRSLWSEVAVPCSPYPARSSCVWCQPFLAPCRL
jgi:hypothetical protein